MHVYNERYTDERKHTMALIKKERIYRCDLSLHYKSFVWHYKTKKASSFNICKSITKKYTIKNKIAYL